MPTKKTTASVETLTGSREGSVEHTAIRVLLVDDHTIVRQGVRALLENDAAAPPLRVIGEASDAVGCLALLAAPPRERPDVVVLDLSLPGVHGTELLRQIRGAGAGPRVVVLTMHAAPEVVARARDAGCDAYVVKGGDVAELAQAIRAVAAGGTYFSSAVAGPPDGAVDRLARLSGRERQILTLIARSGTNKTIAAELGISVHTVNAHRTSLMAKLDIHDAQALTRFAIEHGLVGEEPA